MFTHTRAVQTAGYLGGQEIAFRLLPHTPQDHLNHPLEGRSALCWAVLRADLEMVEAILGRRPTLEGIKSVQSRTTSEVTRVKLQLVILKYFLPGVGCPREVFFFSAGSSGSGHSRGEIGFTFSFYKKDFFQQNMKSEQSHNFADHMFKVREALAVGKAVNQVDRLPLPQSLLDVLKF